MDLDKFDPKDLYDPNDPHIYRTYYADLMTQSLGAKLHAIWCLWAESMISQNLIVPDKVEAVQKMMVPFHQLDPESQRAHLMQVAPIVREFLNWKLIDRALVNKGPIKGKAGL
jgi:hypothetical protein